MEAKIPGWLKVFWWGAFVLTLRGIFPASALPREEHIFVDQVDTTSMSVFPPIGEVKAVMVVAGVYVDTGSYVQYSWPRNVSLAGHWLHNELYPGDASGNFDASQVLTNPDYKWTLSNFFYYDSHGQHKLWGKVNPVSSGPWQNKVIVLEWGSWNGSPYSKCDFFKAVIDTLDQYMDFSEYDSDNNNVVDCVIFMTPCEFFSDPYCATNSIPCPISVENGAVQISPGVRFGLSYQGFQDPDAFWVFQYVISHEYTHSLGIPDKYDYAGPGSGHPCPAGQFHPGGYSGVQGVYSLIDGWGTYCPNDSTPDGGVYQTTYPNSPYDKIYIGWWQPDEVTSSTSLSIPDFLSSVTTNYIGYKIPIELPPGYNGGYPQYFMVTNHQKKFRWEGSYKGTGLLFWHINLNGSNYGGPFSYGGGWWQFHPNDFEETRRREDLELPSGIWDLAGIGLGMESPEFGFDAMDQYASHGLCYPEWNDSLTPYRQLATYTSHQCPGDSSDFFNYGKSFSHLTNPSTDAYNLENKVWYYWDDFYTFDSLCWAPRFPCSEWGNNQYEWGFRQNIATHIAFKNISPPDQDSTISMDVLLDYVQSDRASATGKNNARRLLLDADTLFMAYASRGNIYYTWRYLGDPDPFWMSAYPVNGVRADTLDATGILQMPSGSYPALVKDTLTSDRAGIAWLEGSIPNYLLYTSGAVYSFEVPDTLLGGGWSIISPPTSALDQSGKVHLSVEQHEAIGDQRAILYMNMNLDGSNPTPWDTVDFFDITSDPEVAPSIGVDDNGDIHLVYNKGGEIYYTNSTNGGGSWSAPQNISNSPSTLSHSPSLTASGSKILCVWIEETGGDKYVYAEAIPGTPLQVTTMGVASAPVVDPPQGDLALILWQAEGILGESKIRRVWWDCVAETLGEATEIARFHAQYPQVVSGECEAFIVGTDSVNLVFTGIPEYEVFLTSILTPLLHGDANEDQVIDLGDVVYLINYLFKGGPPPVPCLEAGDANCDGFVDLGDVVSLVNYLFKGGPPPPC